MAVEKEVVQSRFELEGNQALNELGRLEAKAAQLRGTMKQVKKSTEEYKKASSDLSATNKAIDEQRAKLGLTGMTYNQLVRYQKELKREMQTTTTAGTIGYDKLKTKVTEVNAALATQRQALVATKVASEGLGAKVGSIALGAGIGMGVTGAITTLLSLMPKVIGMNGKLSDSLADIQRVSGMTAAEVEHLNNRFKQMDSRTPTENLRNIAIVAGKLGIAKGDIYDFTEAVDHLVVALGDELGDADQITTELGKILNVFKGKITADDLSKLGNAFVELANKGVATGAFMSDFTQRVAGLTKTAGFSLGSVVGLGAGLEELGFRSESSSTALQKVIFSISKDIPAAAKIARMDVGEFNKLFAEKPQEALLKYASGLVKNKKSFSEITKEFENAGEEGARVVSVLAGMGNSADFLRGKMELGNRAMKDTNAIMDAFHLKNETAKADMEVIGKWFASKFVNSNLVKGWQSLTHSVREWITIPTSKKIEEEAFELEKLRIQIMSTKEGTKERTEAIRQLQDKYPEYLKNLDAEKASNLEVSKAIDKVSDSLVNRIILEKHKEEMMEAAEKQADIQIQINEQLKVVEKDLIGIYNSSAKAKAARDELFKNGTPDLFSQAQIVLADKESFGISTYNSRLIELGKTIPKIKDLERERTNAALVNFDLMQERVMLEKIYKAPDKKEANTQPGGTPELPGASDADKKAREKAEKEAEKRRKANQDALDEARKHLAEMDRVLEENGIKREQTLAERKDRELLLIDQKYEAEIVKAGAYEQQVLNNDQLSFEQKQALAAQHEEQIAALEAQWKQARLDKEAEIEAEYQKKKAEVQAQIDLEIAGKEESEVERVKAKYQKLIDLAEQYKLQTLPIYEAMYREIQVLDAKSKQEQLDAEYKLTQERLAANMSMTQGIISLMQAVLGANARYTAAGKVLALAEIGFNMAKALSAASQSAAKAEAESPSFGARGAAQFATTMGIVLSGIAQAYSVMNTNSPDTNLSGGNYSGGGGGNNQKWVGPGGFGSGSGNSTKFPSNGILDLIGFADGGETGYGDAGYGRDQHGYVRGVVHENEFVVPAFVQHRPAVINAKRVIKSEMAKTETPNYTQTQSMSSGYTTTSSDPELLYEVRRMNEKLDRLGDRKVWFVAQDQAKFQQEQDRIKFLAQG